MKRNSVFKLAVAIALLGALPALAFFCSGGGGGGSKTVQVNPGFYVGRGTTSQGGNVSLDVRSEIRTLFFQILARLNCLGLPANVQKSLSPAIPWDGSGSFRQQFDLDNVQYVLSGKFDGQDGVSGTFEAVGRSCSIGFTAARDTSTSDSDGDGVPDNVDPDAVPTGCGDGVVQPPEECDDGNRIGFDACKNDCTNNVCGDGVRRLGTEQCDEGEANSNDPNAACRPDCTSRRCGDSVLDDASGEECDDGNTSAGDGCDAECKSEVSPPQCGDGIVQPPEECDDGNTVSGDGCDAQCNIEEAPECGDGIVQPPEQCDEGDDNSNAPNALCRTDCKNRRCGDGIIDNFFGEQCDDGNTVSGDGCDSTCKTEGSERGAFSERRRTVFD